ncbi:MAG TPA: methyltransferase domain-containing protein [Gemmatimonadaceae bacterium]
MTTAHSDAALETSLRRRFRVIETVVEIDGRSLEILHPASAEDLINELDFERDERLPYWAELWPSSRVLGELVLQMSGAGRTLLELGCGSGLVATCAALAGFDVVASDYYEDACRFAEVNASRNGTRVRGMLLDWRALPAELPRFDVVIASDVLYERPYGALVAGVIDAAIAPDGIALLADPGRVGRDEFLAHLEPNGLVLRERSDLPFSDGEIKQTIGIFEVGRRGRESSPQT